MKASAIYEGSVRHRRIGPRPHEFRQRLFMMYLDLDELPALFHKRWLWSVERTNVVSFRREDYLGPSDRPLRGAVLDRVESKLGRRPRGPVRMLTHLRTWGYVFNPVTFYYCFGTDGAIEAVVAEITNTPWAERHAYVLDARTSGPGKGMRWRFEKDFHVSPFFDMDQQYEWAFNPPGDQLRVNMINREDGRTVFDVAFEAQRRAISGLSLAGVLLRYPLMTIRVHVAIYWQAARLFLKRTPFFTHPDKRAEVREAKS